jgi:ADP-ribose pyrophosphatase YjhB (NUDIX family)
MELVNDNPHCPVCDITIYSNVVGAAAVCIIQEGKVLLSRRAIEPFKGGYDLIGGFTVPGETPEEAAIREANEETGLEIKITSLLGVYSDQYGEGSYTLGVHCIGEIVGGEQRAGDDAASLEWVSIGELPDETLTTGFKNVRESLKDLKLIIGSN